MLLRYDSILYSLFSCFFFFFFFQAEDGIRDVAVTGVQTCALPISTVADKPGEGARVLARLRDAGVNLAAFHAFPSARKSRSEERRVGKECRSRWSADH